MVIKITTMKTEKWVPCTEELAENPHKVKAWRNKEENLLRFIAYDKEHERYPMVFRTLVSDSLGGYLAGYAIDYIECLIEVPIQERFVTFYDGDDYGWFYDSLEEAKEHKKFSCTHIIKLTYDGQKFQVEPVWTKES